MIKALVCISLADGAYIPTDNIVSIEDYRLKRTMLRVREYKQGPGSGFSDYTKGRKTTAAIFTCENGRPAVITTRLRTETIKQRIEQITMGRILVCISQAGGVYIPYGNIVSVEDYELKRTALRVNEYKRNTACDFIDHTKGKKTRTAIFTFENGRPAVRTTWLKPETIIQRIEQVTNGTSFACISQIGGIYIPIENIMSVEDYELKRTALRVNEYKRNTGCDFIDHTKGKKTRTAIFTFENGRPAVRTTWLKSETITQRIEQEQKAPGQSH